jgi:hypothetical protein
MYGAGAPGHERPGEGYGTGEQSRGRCPPSEGAAHLPVALPVRARGHPDGGQERSGEHGQNPTSTDVGLSHVG